MKLKVIVRDKEAGLFIHNNVIILKKKLKILKSYENFESFEIL
jgi:hypothetical protein